MKKIINGKKYNTDTAKYLGTTSHSYPSDFGYWAEALYQKKTGEFFLHGEGGAASKYCRSIGQSCWMGGEEIIPISLDAAKHWAENYLSVDAYEGIFGEVEE